MVTGRPPASGRRPPAAGWVLALLLSTLPALSPLFNLAPTRSADGLLHLYRLVELDQLWRSGIFYSRWLPDLAYGLGLPLLNYYAPLVYYLTTPLHLPGIPFTVALNLSLAAALLLGALGMFLLAGEVIGLSRLDAAQPGFQAPAALVAALAYLYAPYLLFNALFRANLAEQWALAFAPWALWSVARLAAGFTPARWLAAVLAFAAVLLSHNVTGLAFAPLLLGWIVVLALASARAKHMVGSQVPSPPPFQTVAPGLAAFAAGLALAAFFWLPALVEREWVQIARVIVTPDFDYHYNFASLTELVAFLPRADTGQLSPAFPATLGPVQVVLAALGLLALVRRRRAVRTAPLLYLLLGGCATIALMLPLSTFIWDHAPLLAYIQLPTRLRGVAALLLAPFAGAALYILPPRFRSPAAGVAVVALFLTALPLLYPRYARDVPPNPTLSDMFAYEQRVGAIGTTSFGEYLPVWVQDVPDHSPLEQAYAGGASEPDRFVVPPGVQICGGSRYPLAQILCASSPVAWRAVVRAFYFPGWRAWIDGQPATLTATAGDGLIALDVPAGEPVIAIEYGDTATESASNVISLSTLALVAIVSIIALVAVRRSRPSAAVASWSFSSSPFPFLLLALLLIGVKSFYADRFDSPFVVHSDGAHVAGVETPLRVNFGGALELLGFNLDSQQLRPGETLRVTLFWRAPAKLSRNLSVFVHLTAADGRVLAQKDNLHPANLPTSLWEPDGYVSDVHTFAVPGDLAPGQYDLRAGVYDPDGGARLQTARGGDYQLLAEIHVVP